MTTLVDINTNHTPGNDATPTPSHTATSSATEQPPVSELIAFVLTQLQAQTGSDLRHYLATAPASTTYGLDFWQAIADLMKEVQQRRDHEVQLQFQADVLQQVSEAVIAIDHDERIIYLNAAAAAQYDLDPVTALAQPLTYAHHDEWLQPEDEAIAYAALAERGYWRGENRHIKRNGSVIFVESTVSVLRDRGGNATGLLACIHDISAHKQAEAALRASEARFRHLADAMPQLVWTATQEGVVDYYNIRIHDYDEAVWQGAYGFDWQRFLHPDDLAATLAVWQAATKRCEPYVCEHRLRMADGSWRWHLSRALLAYDSGHVIKWYGTSTDIHERKQAEERLRQSEERYRYLFETMDEGFCVVEMLFDATGQPVDYRFLETNPAFERFTGLTQAKAKTARQLVPNLEAHWVEIYGRVATTGQPLRFVEGSAAMGRWFDVYAFRVGAEASRRVALLFNNITERKRTEDALRTSEARFRQLADAMPHIVWACLADGTLTYINARWQTYSGMNFAESIEQGMWPALHPADQITNRDQWRRALESGQAYEAEVRLRRVDGEYCWHLERAVPVRGEGGVIEQWFGASVDIHDYKCAQEALAVANERFVLAEHASNGWVYDLDLQQWTVECSPGFYRILGYTPDKVTLDVKWWHSLFHPDDQYLVEEPAILARNAEEFTEVEYRVRHRDGYYVHLLDRSRNIVDAAGRRVRVVGITVDISERKRAELHQQFLNELGMQLRLLSDTDAIMELLVSKLGQHLQVAGCRVNKVDLANNQFIVQKDWAAAPKQPVAPGHAAAVYPLLELAPLPVLAELKAGHTVVVINTQTDSRTAAVVEQYRTQQVTAFVGIPILHQGQWNATLSVREQGERLWRRDEIALLETVASQFQALREKVRAEQALRRSEERLRLALSGGGMGIWEWQVANNRSIWNEEEYALFGLPPGTTITDELFDQLIHPADLPSVRAKLNRVSTQGMDYTGEFRIVRPDGAVRWLAERATIIRNEAGGLRVLGINYDITERKQSEQALQELNATLEQRVAERTAALEEMNQELTRSNRELEQFTYAAAHDLKSPLRGIQNLVQWISEDAVAVLPPKSQKHLDQLHRRVQRLESLLDDMLAYSRIGRVRYAPEKVDVNLLVQNIVELMAAPPGFTVITPAALPTLITWRAPLETVLRNLINNALKHHHHPLTGTVQITARMQQDWVEFFISDDGPGIAPEFHERIFGMFQTLKPRDQVEGSGIGLALVKKTVESYGGQIELDSAVGQGTVVRFTWPKDG